MLSGERLGAHEKVEIGKARNIYHSLCYVDLNTMRRPTCSRCHPFEYTLDVKRAKMLPILESQFKASGSRKRFRLLNVKFIACCASFVFILTRIESIVKLLSHFLFHKRAQSWAFFDYSDLWCVSAHVIYFLSSIGVKFMFIRFNKFTINAWFLWPATITRSITQFGGPLICFYLLIKHHSDSSGRSAKIAVNFHSMRIFNASQPFPFSTRTQEICRWIESI